MNNRHKFSAFSFVAINTFQKYTLHKTNDSCLFKLWKSFMCFLIINPLYTGNPF